MRLHVLILIALLLVPLFCATSYVREFIAVDSALDSSASYDYATGRADHTTHHPFIPFFHRHLMLVISAGVLLATAVVYVSCVVSVKLRGLCDPTNR